MRKRMGWMLSLCILMLLFVGCLAESEILPEETPVIMLASEPSAVPTPAETPSPLPKATPSPAPKDGPTPASTAIPTEPPAERQYLLPIDFSKGRTPVKSGYSGDGKTVWKYEDPTLSVHITKGRVKGKFGCDYWVATVKIQDASQLRTASKSGFNYDNITMDAMRLAKRQNAVLAVNGDYYCYTGKGLILRQGKSYLDILTGDMDVLLIDEDGDFHVMHKPKKDSVKYQAYSAAGNRGNGNVVYTDKKSGQKYYKVYEINGKKVLNAFYFGPILVENGKVNSKLPAKDGDYLRSKERKQRMAIAQVGPLEYKCICCAPPKNNNDGMDLKTFANLVAKQHVQTAYNLDGGYSSYMIFNNKQVNNVANDNRQLVDIIYFASAYNGE